MMSRRSLACFVVTLLAVAALLVLVEPASAQRGSRGGFGFGYSPGTGMNFGYGNAYQYGNPYYGGRYNPSQYSYGQGYYPGYSGYGWNTPGYRWSEGNYNWNTPAYSTWSTPSYYNEGIQGSYYGSSYGAGTGFGSESYGAMSPAGIDNRVWITAHVPPSAEIWFEDQKTSQTGNIRSFISPPLESDRNLVYHIRARWTEDGRQVEKERKLEVHPGDRLFVNFVKPRAEGTGQFGTEPENRTQQRNPSDTTRPQENP